MVPSRFQLRGDSLEGIEWRLFNSHGNRARIISAERVTEGGIAGFFARHFYEVTVELRDDADGVDGMGPAVTVTAIPLESGAPSAAPGPTVRPRPHVRAPSGTAGARPGSAGARPAAAGGGPVSAGIEALLREADKAEAAASDGAATDAPAGVRNPAGSGAAQGPDLAVPRVSTGSGDFAALLDELTSTVSPDRSSATPAVPALVSGPGRVVLVVGLGLDPVETARSMGTELGGAVEIRTAGARRAGGMDHVVGRNGITAARAAGAAAGRTVVVAFGLRTDGVVPAAALSDLAADQVWLAVDAARKPADTASWARKVGWAIEVDALAVLGSQETLTPGTVNELGIPIGWVDGEPAARTTL